MHYPVFDRSHEPSQIEIGIQQSSCNSERTVLHRMKEADICIRQKGHYNVPISNQPMASKATCKDQPVQVFEAEVSALNLTQTQAKPPLQPPGSREHTGYLISQPLPSAENVPQLA